MDGLSVAGSVVSLAAITGQLIQSTKALYEFWTFVKEVPTRLQWLGEDLKCLEDSFVSFRQLCAQKQSTIGVQNWLQALQRCSFHLRNLEALVAPFRTQIEDGRMQRVWRSIKAEFNANKVEEFRANLEAAKASLLLVQTALTQESVLTTEHGLASLLMEQKNLQESFTRQIQGLHDRMGTVHHDKESILMIKRGVASLQIEQKTAGDSTSREHQELYDQIASLGRDVGIIADSSTSNTGEGLALSNSSTLEKMLESVVQKILVEHSSKFEVIQSRHREPPASSHVSATSPVQSDTSYPDGTPQRPGGTKSWLKKRISLFEKSFSTPFGYLSLRYDKIWRDRTRSGAGGNDPVFEFWLSIVPRSLFSRKAFVITGTWKSIPRPSLTVLNVQPRPMISSKSAVREACWDGDIATMAQLFRSKKASPHDVDEYGEDLLTLALDSPCRTRYETCKFLLDVGYHGPASDDNALAHVMVVSALWEKELTHQEIFESDLKVVRLLLEVGRIEQIHGTGLMIGLALQCEQSRIPPALEYLLKQEHFDFGLSDIFETGNLEILRSWISKAELSSIVRGLCVCVGNINKLFNTGGESLVVEVVSKYLRKRVEPDEQHELFNEAVIAFSLLLKHGFHPSVKVRFDEHIVTVSRLTHVDPEFTGVAWRLALKLNGWILPPSPKQLAYHTFKLHTNHSRAKPCWSDDGTDDESNDSKNTILKSKSDQIASTNADGDFDVREEGPRVPGAWIDDEDIEDEDPFPPMERPSRFRDFTGCVRGYQWDPSLYLASEFSVFDAPLEVRLVSWW